MMERMIVVFVAVALVTAVAVASEPADEAVQDPWLWLEEVEGEKALDWVKKHNVKSTAELEAVPEYQAIYDRTLEILDSDERIPYPNVRGDWLYNLWQDEEHERGIWRRTGLESYRTDEPEWETVLDLDAMSEADGVPWVLGEVECLPFEYRHCMLGLSRGGSDAVTWREFDAEEKAFVEDGFEVPEAKTLVSWKDENTIWVGSDFGEGSLTTSGYPRIVKEWRRGTPLAEARQLFEVGEKDVMGVGGVIHTPQGTYQTLTRIIDFFNTETYLLLGGRLVRVAIPDDASINGIFEDQLLFSLRGDWTVGETTFKEGSLLATDVDHLLQQKDEFQVLFEPTETVSLAGVAMTRDRVLLTVLDNVRGKLYRLARNEGAWQQEEVALPGVGTIMVFSARRDRESFFLTYEDFLTPRSLFLVQDGELEKVKALPAFFDSKGMKVEQLHAVSKDGTEIPYFLVTPPGFVADGTTPTLLYGYGGFEVSEVPRCNSVKGSAWLERGGAYALANLRGGGEFGPRWHKAALRDKRIKSFEDFIAVAEDLIATKVTTPKHLGIMGGSQGGLLVGGTFTMRPDLFGAVVSQVPLADMKRFHKLLAGASWMSEYGNPDVPEDWDFIQTWSPYHLLKKDATYPKVFYWTTTRDDRVHPGHARKMVAKMEAMGHPVYYFENIEGGHGSGSVNRQRAAISALEYAYLWKMLRPSP
jgi:prolyl oligopeptidase